MSLSDLNSLCQENKISIKKIFLMLIRGVSVPNTHYAVKYRIVCWLLLWSQYPSSWSAAKDHSLSAHISWDRKKWMQPNSHLTFLIPLPLMSSGKLVLPSLVWATPPTAVLSAQTDGIFLALSNNRQSAPLQSLEPAMLWWLFWGRTAHGTNTLQSIM